MQIFSVISQMVCRHIPVWQIINKLDGVAPLVADPPCANSTTDTDTHPLSDVGGPEQYF